MIQVYSGFKGLLFSLAIAAGIVLFFSIFCWGVTKAALLLVPLLIVLSYALIAVFIVGILPATLVKRLRPTLSLYAMSMSHALGVAAWMMAFFFVIKAYSFWGILLVFLFQFMAPIAVVGAMLQGAWSIAANLSVWILLATLMKFYSYWVTSLDTPENRRTSKDTIIDVEIVEPKQE